LPIIDRMVDMSDPQSIQVENQSNDASSFPQVASLIPQTIPQIITKGTMSATENIVKFQSKKCDKLTGVGTADNCLIEDDLPDNLPDGSLYEVCLPSNKRSVNLNEKVPKKKNIKIKDRKKVEKGELDVIFERIREKKKLKVENKCQEECKETERVEIDAKENEKVTINLDVKEDRTPEKKKIQSSMSKWVKIEKKKVKVIKSQLKIKRRMVRKIKWLKMLKMRRHQVKRNIRILKP